MKNTLTTPMNNEISDFRSFAETQPRSPIADSEKTSTCISLHKFVSSLIDDLLSRTSGNLITIINDVPSEMLVSTDKNTLTTITANLLDIFVMNSQSDSIHISAKLIGNLTLLHMRSSDATYTESMANSMQKIEPMAETLGGCITLSNSIRKGLSLAFTFIND
ncbi:MAG: hypothetical protein JJE22_15670 [Bacteroidia bacterium]|nr:hypothetical protein [Bacteroidia bacterium]